MLNERRAEVLLFALFGAAAWVVRASPYFRASGVLGWPVDYDEGVYLSASALLSHGTLPWRDFVFVHPPLVPGVLSLVTRWNVTPSEALSVARWLVATLGAVNVVLAGLVVRRHAGLVGGCLAAGLLCVWPEVVLSDRGVHLEPFLTAACLMATWKHETKPLSAGLWLGVALLVKSWALVWLVGWLVARGRRALPGIVLSLLVVGAVCLPLLFIAPEFFEQVVLFHLRRPPDGDASTAVRLREMFVSRSMLPAAMLLTSVPIFWTLRDSPLIRWLLVTSAGLVAAFLGAAAYWNQYNAHLAFPLAMLCGLGMERVIERVPQLPRHWAVALLVGVVVGAPNLVWVIDRRKDKDPEQLEHARVLKEQAEAVCTFEPQELILADRWPPALPGTRVLVDSYGQMLLEATRGGRRFDSASMAFQSEESQATIRNQLRACPRWFLGWRGAWQLNDASEAMIEPAALVHLPDR